jgi:hypothetical protein
MISKSKSCSMVSAVLAVCFINKVANGAGDWMVDPGLASGEMVSGYWMLD